MTTPLQQSPKREQFKQAEQQWDLERLYRDLASTKGQYLTPVERLHLRGLLCGHSPAEIADKLKKELRSVENALSATIYSYVKELSSVGKKIRNWQNISKYLEEAGYKKQPDFPLRKFLQGITLPLEALEGLITVNQRRCNNYNNQKIFEINIRIVVPVPEGEKEEDSSD